MEKSIVPIPLKLIKSPSSVIGSRFLIVSLAFICALSLADQDFAQEETDKSGVSKETVKEPAKTPEEIARDRKTREAAKKRGELTFDDLKFEMDKGAPFKEGMLSEDNKSLHNKTWKIRGFILPATLFSRKNIRDFVLVRDNQECCFGPGAALYDCIMVKMVPGKSIDFKNWPVTVKGVLEIDTKTFADPVSGEPFAVYKMTAEEVK